LVDLEEFKIEELSLEKSDSLMPTDRTVDSAFMADMDLIDIPRSVMVLSPEAMAQFQIRDFSDLNKVGAGTSRINYYGVPGAPILRGAKGGTYFNGMLRAFNRNEMPISFGSLEALDVVRGPAPSHLEVTNIGGYVNFIPKSPFFDENRGSIQLQAGSHDFYNVKVDSGGPLLLGSKPSAYRVSITGQSADSYYDNVSNNFLSIYGSVKSELSKNVKLFAGAEYYRFRSNENVGWNRPTQALIDNGEYVIGESPDISTPVWNGVANRNLTEWPYNTIIPGLVALAVPGDIARERIPASQLTLMHNLNLQVGLDQTYRVLSQEEIDERGIFLPAWFNRSFAEAELATITPDIQDAYVYTPEYFENGGQVLTEKINGSTVLADPNDFADSEDLIAFFDFEFLGNPDRRIEWKNFLEYLNTQKQSSYGYAIDTQQTIVASKLLITDKVLIPRTKLQYGVGIRYTDAWMVQDFFAEPFSRRDITSGTISSNSIILTGSQIGPDGKNFWSPSGGANVASGLLQTSVFAQAKVDFNDSFFALVSGRIEYADFDVSLPPQVDRGSPSLEETLASGSGHKTITSISLNPVIKLDENFSLYGAAQVGTSMDPTQGGPIFGEDNFAEAKLYEIGLKGSFAENSLYFSGAVYRWEQNRFNTRDARSEPLEAEGLEFEMTWKPVEPLTLIVSFDNLQVKRNSSLGFRSLVMTEQDWALSGGILNAAGGVNPPSNPNLIYPGFPERNLKLFAIYQLENGLGFAGGPIWQDAFWLNFDRTIRLPSSTVWNFNCFYKTDSWETMLSIENAFDEDYFLGSEPVFGANTLVTKAPDVEGTLTVTIFF
ncbi:MAG: hypothetical protein O7C75_07265, partial [Verrucomicrobia bacterium]|nr:hypothetical protein [Verrucomicrobiota bacterium]